MPRHLISDAHEWINEIPTVPIYYLAKPQPRERAWVYQRGKKTLLTAVYFYMSIYIAELSIRALRGQQQGHRVGTRAVSATC
jgi:hypothetical protein